MNKFYSIVILWCELRTLYESNCNTSIKILKVFLQLGITFFTYTKILKKNFQYYKTMEISIVYFKQKEALQNLCNY